MTCRLSLLVTTGALLGLAACSGGSAGGGIASTPAPTPAPTPSPTPTPTSPLVPNTINFDTAEYRRSNGAVAAQAIPAWQAGATGAGVVAAVIDSGVASSNAEFAGRISPLSRDLAGARGIVDEDGHGTEVSAILLAARDGANIHGVAFGATLLALRADSPGSCDQTNGCGFGSTAIAAGFDAAASAGARVVNLSLGGGSSNLQVRAAAARAVAAGAVVVVSAGNESLPEIDGFANGLRLAAPGSVIVAGAIDEARTIFTNSNRAGSAAEHYLVALGVRVRSFDHLGVNFLYSGTSEAAPIVSGAVALLAQAYPTLTPAQIVDILLRTADDLGATGTDPVYGRGALNIARAFAPIGPLSVEKVADRLDASATGVLAGPLGDASHLGMAVSKLPVHDLYGRAYSVDLGTTLRRQAPGRLANALLGGDASSGGGRYGAADVAVSVRGGGGANWRGDVATGVDARDRPRAAFLGGQAQVLLAPGRSLVLGYGQSAAAMLDTAAGADGIVAPFVATLASETGLVAQPEGGVAVTQRWGAWTVGTAFGTQRMALGAGRDTARASRAVLRADRTLGALRIGIGAELMVEQGSLLGSQLPPVFGIAGASTTSALLRLALPMGDWALLGDARIGTTSAALSGTGLLQGGARLTSSAASLSLSRAALLADNDRISLTIAQPLRAMGMVTLATEAAAVRLGPSGRETALELGYLRPLDTGSLSLAAFWRDQPGNIAPSPADAGVAARLRVRF